jgi:hypothetical protein
MKRPFAAILILLVFWATAAVGLSGVCCCPTDGRDFVGCGDEAGSSGHQDPCCGHKGTDGHDCNQACPSLRCADAVRFIGLAERDSVLPPEQGSLVPTAMTNSAQFVKTVSMDSWQPRLSPKRPVLLLLQICSFLS